MEAFSPSNSSAGATASPPSFVAYQLGGWICPHCISLPYHQRSPGWFSPHQPSGEHVDHHFATCTGLATAFHRSRRVDESNQYLSVPPFHPSSHPLPSNMAWPSVPGYNMGLRETSRFMRPSGMHDSVPPPQRPAQLPPQLPMLQPQVHPVGHAPLSFHHATHQPPHQNAISEYMTPAHAVPVVDKVREAAIFLETECQARAKYGSDKEELIMPEDKHIITDYFYFLVQQLRICRFEEADRKTRGGKRENLDVGYGGLQCRHCAGERRARKFFWTDVDRLANSFSEISGHVMKCLECPEKTKAALRQLKLRHLEQMAKMPRGSQKVFFRRVWRRLHPQKDDHFGVVSGCSGAVSSTVTALVDGKGSHQMEAAKSEGTVTNRDFLDNRKRGHNGDDPSTLDVYAPSSVPLAIESDKEWLSDMDCTVRDSLEVFRASVEDVEAYHSCSVKLNQVGIRCTYCASTPKGAEGPAVRFPYSLSILYEKVCEIHRSHLIQCPNCPTQVIHKLSQLEKTTSKSLSSISRRYYMVAAKHRGLHDTPNGIFLREPDTGATHELDGVAAATDSAQVKKGENFPSGATAASSVELSSRDAGLSFSHEITDCRQRRNSSPFLSMGGPDFGANPDDSDAAETDSSDNEKTEKFLPGGAVALSFELPSHDNVGISQFSEEISEQNKRKRRSISPLNSIAEGVPEGKRTAFFLR